MLSEKICFSDGIDINGREYCQTTSELFNSKSLYILLERFSNIVIKKNHEYDDFLNRYFNIEGYIDIWHIPHLLVDLVTGSSHFNVALLNDEIFRNKFMSFLGEFYNYCIKESNLLLIQDRHFTEYKSNLFHMRKNQYLYDLIAETYCKVYGKLNSLGEPKIGENI